MVLIVCVVKMLYVCRKYFGDSAVKSYPSNNDVSKFLIFAHIYVCVSVSDLLTKPNTIES